MQEVAKRAGVALSTVSYALNGTRPISDETRQRILRAMDELGYQPHAMARGLASKRTRIIALLFPASGRGLGATALEIVTGAAGAARAMGYHLVVWSTEAHGVDELRSLLSQGLVDGVVVMRVRLRDDRIDLLRTMDVPFSMIGRTASTADVNFADIDYDQTTREAVDYLVGLGHRKIAFLNHSRESFEAGYGPSVRAAAGFESAVRSAGLEPIMWLCDDAPQAGRQALDELLVLHPDLTALVAMNELAIVGVMHAIRERGWRVPDDLSIMSLVSAVQTAEMTMPPLTAMTPPYDELGRLGVDVLIERLERQAAGRPRPLQGLLPCRLVVRGSTAPPRAATATPAAARG